MMTTNYHPRSAIWGGAFAITILAGLTNVQAQTCLPDGITFTSQAQIDDFSAEYPECTTILGDVLIEEEIAGNIKNLQGLSQITVFGAALDIKDNTALINLNGLEAVTSINGRLNIAANTALTSLDGLNNLSSIGESLRISSNYALSNIAALGAITKIQGDLSISFNDVLPNLSGLQGVTSIGGHLIISHNRSLTNLKGLNAVASISKVVQIDNNALLMNLHGLDSLVLIGEDLIVDSNPSLITLKGLYRLTTVGRFLQIVNNDALPSLTGLEALTSIRGLLQIYNNPSLTSLSGIDSINHNGITDLAIIACEKLSACSVRSVCNYLDIGVNLASIRGNEKYCNSRATILDACNREGLDIVPPRFGIVFFPNPTSGILNIKGFGTENAKVSVTDSLGKLVLQSKLTDNYIDLSYLPSGLYFVELTTERETVIEPVCRVE